MAESVCFCQVLSYEKQGLSHFYMHSKKMSDILNVCFKVYQIFL